MNDVALTLLALEVTLGANPQGLFASVAARLHALDGGGGGGPSAPNIVPLPGTPTATVPGTSHDLGTADLFWQVWDAGNPRQPVEPQTVTVNPTTFDVQVTFAAGQDGHLVLGNLTPRYAVSFLNQTTITVTAATHGLGLGPFLLQLYDPTGLSLSPSLATLNIANGTVVVTFATTTSGRLILSPGQPSYSTAFTAQTVIAIPGSTHGLGNAPLLFQLIDAQTPAVLIPPGLMQQDTTSGDVTVSFAGTQSGRILLSGLGPPATMMAGPMAAPMRAPHRRTPLARSTNMTAVLETMLRRIESLEATVAALTTPPDLPPTEEMTP